MGQRALSTPLTRRSHLVAMDPTCPRTYALIVCSPARVAQRSPEE